MLRHRKLKHDYRSELAPIFEKKADRSRGELFPAIWYSSDEHVTAVQHLEIANMILTAQNPYLSYVRHILSLRRSPCTNMSETPLELRIAKRKQKSAPSCSGYAASQ